ncbi:MAG: hypothetical protein ACK52I_07190 [Pseudomonadota bacterium]|jgi:hypothetical protein
MIFLAGSVLFFGGIISMLVGVLFDWSERAVKLSSVAGHVGLMLWLLSSMLSAAPAIMETMP